MTDEHSQDIDLHETEEGIKFHRGSALSIFEKDRNEDYIALIIALLIALGVYVTVA